MSILLEVKIPAISATKKVVVQKSDRVRAIQADLTRKLARDHPTLDTSPFSLYLAPCSTLPGIWTNPDSLLDDPLYNIDARVALEFKRKPAEVTIVFGQGGFGADRLKLLRTRIDWSLPVSQVVEQVAKECRAKEGVAKGYGLGLRDEYEALKAEVAGVIAEVPDSWTFDPSQSLEQLQIDPTDVLTLRRKQKSALQLAGGTLRRGFSSAAALANRTKSRSRLLASGKRSVDSSGRESGTEDESSSGSRLAASAGSGHAVSRGDASSSVGPAAASFPASSFSSSSSSSSSTALSSASSSSSRKASNAARRNSRAHHGSAPSATPYFGIPLADAVRKAGGLPSVIRHTVQYIEETGLDVEGIFRLSGSATKIAELKGTVDAGSDVHFEPGTTNIHDVCGLLKLYLRELPEGIFTDALYPVFKAAGSAGAVTSRTHFLRAAIRALPPPNHMTAIYLLRFLVKVRAHSAANKMHDANIATIFGGALMQSQALDDHVAISRLVQALLDSLEELFDERVPLPFVGIGMATHDYVPSDTSAGQVGFAADTVIFFTQREDDDWWRGVMVDGTSGIVPAPFLIVLKEFPAHSAKSSSAITKPAAAVTKGEAEELVARLRAVNTQ